MIRYKNSIGIISTDAIFVSIKLIFFLFSFFDEVSWATFHLGINLADINTRDAYTRGDDASDKPHGNKHGGPALDSLALEIFYQGKDNHDDCYQSHRQTQEGDKLQWCHGERSDAIDTEAQHLGKRILTLTRLTSLAGYCISAFRVRLVIMRKSA